MVINIHSVGQKAKPYPLDKLLKKYRKAIFIYSSSEADERYFKARMADFIREHVRTDYFDNPESWYSNAGESFKEFVTDLVWERNDKGITSKYMYFAERAQKLWLDRTFWEWAQMVGRMIRQELETIEKR